jgi:hypothetical protein
MDSSDPLDRYVALVSAAQLMNRLGSRPEDYFEALDMGKGTFTFMPVSRESIDRSDIGFVEEDAEAVEKTEKMEKIEKKADVKAAKKDAKKAAKKAAKTGEIKWTKASIAAKTKGDLKPRSNLI